MQGSLILDRLHGKQRVLLLQGPVGPFFDRLAVFLRESGIKVVKVNFNGGDEWNFRQPGAVAFREGPDHWPTFFESLLSQHRIDAIVLFGDCRPYHRSAILRARLRGIAVYVFEEGYVRPNYITFEYHGVNAFSILPRFPHLFANFSAPTQSINPPGRLFRSMALHAITYYLMGRIRRSAYPNYRHHKPFELYPEALYWVRSALRKIRFRWRERGMEDYLSGPLLKRFFLVPLQVYNDSQVRQHSSFLGVRAFITEVLESFSRSAPCDVHLVLKHHPMDRGHRCYAPQILRQARHMGIEDRVHYVHDLHLPTLLKSALGTVVINSTVGLSSLFHGTPLKVMGRAMYDIPGLTYQGALDDFWREPLPPDPELVAGFRNYLIEMTQIGGSFYADDPIIPADHGGLNPALGDGFRYP